jgi:hypothetical protein
MKSVLIIPRRDMALLQLSARKGAIYHVHPKLKPNLAPTDTRKNDSTLGLSEFLQIPETQAARIPEYLGNVRSGYYKSRS